MPSHELVYPNADRPRDPERHARRDRAGPVCALAQRDLLEPQKAAERLPARSFRHPSSGKCNRPIERVLYRSLVWQAVREQPGTRIVNRDDELFRDCGGTRLRYKTPEGAPIIQLQYQTARVTPQAWKFGERVFISDSAAR